MYHPEPPYYLSLRLPALLFRFQANAKEHYVELLKLGENPSLAGVTGRYVVHEVSPREGRCWEFDDELDALQAWRKVCSGHPPMGSKDDGWLCREK